MNIRTRQSSPDSPRGEVDTSSPFSSVKHAVALFLEVALSGDKTPKRKARAKSIEMAFVKEMQLHLTEKELNALKNQIKNAEAIKAKALAELEKTKRTIEYLTLKLKAVCESKESAAKATEAASDRLELLKEESDGKPVNGKRELDREAARGQYRIAIKELNDTKKELVKIRQDFDAVLEAKIAALKHAEEAERAAKANMEKASDLSKEISDMKESIAIVKAASFQGRKERVKINAANDVQTKSYKSTLEATTKKLLDLKSEYDPEATQKLEAQLAETVSEIDSLQKKMEDFKNSDLESPLKVVAAALDDAKKSLQKVAEEENSLCSLVDALKAELENVKNEHSEIKRKEAETEFISGNLNVKLQTSKSEVRACNEEKAKTRGEYNDMILSLRKLSLETENARKESEDMLLEAEEAKKEAENARRVMEECENKLRVALEEAEEAKTAETKALDLVKESSEKASAEFSATITIPREEYESLSHKAEESDKLAEMKVAAAMAEGEAVRASESEALKKLEANLKEMEEMKATTESALRKADMAEHARMVVEGELQRWREKEARELQRWREREEKEGGELQSWRGREEKEGGELQSWRKREEKEGGELQSWREREGNEGELYHLEKAEPKLENARTTVSRTSFRRSMSGVFHKKRNLSDFGSSSSSPEHPLQPLTYLPEHPTL